MNYDVIYCICQHCDIRTFIQIIQCNTYLLKLADDQDLSKNILDRYFTHHSINISYDVNFMKECYIGKQLIIYDSKTSVYKIYNLKIYNLKIYPWNTYDDIYKKFTSDMITFGSIDSVYGRCIIEAYWEGEKDLPCWNPDPNKYLVEENVYNQVTHIGV